MKSSSSENDSMNDSDLLDLGHNGHNKSASPRFWSNIHVVSEYIMIYLLSPE